jgi:AraC-like DNA-binding protein
VLGLDTRVPFAWMLPLVLGSTVLSAVTLWSSGGPRTVGVVPAQWIVGFAIAVNIAQIVRMQFGHIAPVRALVPIVLSAGFLGLTMLLVRRALVTATPRYERSGLEDAVGAELVTRVEAALVRDRLFARADLTLADLAAAAAATPHQVSEALNRVAGVSFHDFVNRRRVDDVKSQLLDPSSERFTIEGIGLSAGFGSRSALYAAFRRFEGMTPTAFRASPQRHRGAAGGV